MRLKLHRGNLLIIQLVPSHLARKMATTSSVSSHRTSFSHGDRMLILVLRVIGPANH